MLEVGVSLWEDVEDSRGSGPPVSWHQAVSQTVTVTETGTYSLGNKVTVTKIIQIRALTLLDSGQDGIGTSVIVRFGMRDPDFKELAVATIPTGTAARLSNGHRVVNLASPVVVPPGIYYIWVSAARNPFSRIPPSFDTSDAFVYDDSRYAPSGFPSRASGMVTYVPCGFEYLLL